jgi:hypothetical protein
MGELFIAIFNRGEVPKEVSQLNVLTLYYEFRELTPIGQQGDEMIQKLAERLVNLDLLDRAAALLTHQVRFRLSGEEKDRVSTRLAEIHLMNRKPKLALEVLRATDSSRLENQPERAIYRRKLKAKALLAMDRLEEVLDMVQGDLSLESAFLRADVHWQRKEWAGVVEALESPFRRIYREDRILSVAESTQIVRLAVAYTLLKKQDKLQRLRRDFIDYLPDEARKHLFEFVATADNALDINDLQGSLRLDQMEKFLSSYIANKNNKKIWQENQ